MKEFVHFVVTPLDVEALKQNIVPKGVKMMLIWNEGKSVNFWRNKKCVLIVVRNFLQRKKMQCIVVMLVNRKHTESEKSYRIKFTQNYADKISTVWRIIYMRKFEIIEDNSDSEKIDRVTKLITLHDCWQRQYHNAVCDAMIRNEGKQIQDYQQEDLMKIALSGIKYINFVREVRRGSERLGIDSRQSLEESQAIFNLIDSIFTVMGYIKLKDLIITFPVTKEYDGDKDYFYTMDVLSKMDMDKPIGRDNISELMWDYENDDLRHAYVEFTCAMSNIYRSQTGKGLAEKFCEDNGIGTYTVYRDVGIIKDNSTGQTMKLNPKGNMEIVK